MKKIIFILIMGMLLMGCASSETSTTEENSVAEVETESAMDDELETEEAPMESTEKTTEEEVSEDVTETETIAEEEVVAYTYTDLDKVMYAKQSVNVRDLPSADGNKLGGLSAAEEVHVTGQCNETSWYRIEYNDGIAYVSNSYLMDEKPEVTTQASSGGSQEVDQYGGYYEYQRADGGYYCIGGYKFSVEYFDLLRDSDKLFYKAFADAGLGNITYVKSNDHGGRVYGIMFPVSESDDVSQLYQDYMYQLRLYTASLGLVFWQGAPNEGQAMGHGGWFYLEGVKNGVYHATIHNLYTEAEVEYLRSIYYPNNASSFTTDDGMIWYNYFAVSPLYGTN